MVLIRSLILTVLDSGSPPGLVKRWYSLAFVDSLPPRHAPNRTNKDLLPKQ